MVRVLSLSWGLLQRRHAVWCVWMQQCLWAKLVLSQEKMHRSSRADRAEQRLRLLNKASQRNRVLPRRKQRQKQEGQHKPGQPAALLPAPRQGQTPLPAAAAAEELVKELSSPFDVERVKLRREKPGASVLCIV